MEAPFIIDEIPLDEQQAILQKVATFVKQNVRPKGATGTSNKTQRL